MEQLDDLSLHYGWSVREKQRIDELINRQSRITAIGFEKWKMAQGWLPEEDSDTYRSYYDSDEPTLDQLYDKYELYLQSLNK